MTHASELHVIEAIGADELPSVDLVFDEVKSTFRRQAERIDALTVRATWIVATALVILAAVTGRAADIGKLHPGVFTVIGLVGGVVIAIVAAGLGIVAAALRTYQEGIRIDALQTDYLWWTPMHSKVQWIADYRDMHERNEAALGYRARLIWVAFVVLGVAIAILTAAGVALTNKALVG
jgi:hypothetical protein